MNRTIIEKPIYDKCVDCKQMNFLWVDARDKCAKRCASCHAKRGVRVSPAVGC